jgi:hypothetical protein
MDPNRPRNVISNQEADDEEMVLRASQRASANVQGSAPAAQQLSRQQAHAAAVAARVNAGAGVAQDRPETPPKENGRLDTSAHLVKWWFLSRCIRAESKEERKERPAIRPFIGLQRKIECVRLDALQLPLGDAR